MLVRGSSRGSVGLDALLAGHPVLPNDTAVTAAALWFQPVFPEAVARSLKSAGFLGVALASWDFRCMGNHARQT